MDPGQGQAGEVESGPPFNKPMKYRARHLKSAIGQALVHPMSNLITTQQVHGGN